MKVVLSLLIVFSFHALAVPQFSRPIVSVVDAEEAERLQHLRDAKTLEEALEYMTPAELAEDLGMPTLEEYLSDLESTGRIFNVGDVKLRIDVSLAQQSLTMAGTDTSLFNELISSGRKGHPTPTGCRTPIGLDRHYVSKKYGSPMPYSVFFLPGYALHQGFETEKLGSRASHGCIRQSRDGARYVYAEVLRYVKQYGYGSVLICIR